MKKELSHLLLNVCILGAVLVIAGFFIFSINSFKTEKVSAQSAPGDMHGYAWSSNIGWISFNGSDEGASGNYKVTIDQQTGYLSGYAWSSNIGWIKFGGLSGFPTNGNGTVQDNARLTDDGLTGWARVCAGTVNGDCTGASRTDGWDGWISLSGIADDGGRYGVVRQDNRLVEFAWGGLLGWLSFTNDYTITIPDPDDPDGPGEGCTGVCFGGGPVGSNILNISARTLVDASYVYLGGITATTPYGSYVTGATSPGITITKTNTINGPISVPASFEQNSITYEFENWEGCDSTSGTSCTITVSNVTKSIYANYVDTTTQPEVPLNVDLKVNGTDGPITLLRGLTATISWQITGKGTATCSLSVNDGVTNTVLNSNIDENGSISTGILDDSLRYTVTCTKGAVTDSDSVIIKVNIPGEN